MAQDRLWQMEMWRRAARRTDGGDRRARRGRARSRGAAAEVPRAVRRLASGRAITPTASGSSRRSPPASTRSSPQQQGPPADRVRGDRASRRSRGRSSSSCCGRRRSATRPASCSSRATSRGSACRPANRARNPDPPDELDGARRPRSSRRSPTRSSRPRGRGGGGRCVPRAAAGNSAARVAGRRPTTRAVPRARQQQLGRRAASRSATGHPVVANDPHREVTQPVAALHRPSAGAGLERRSAPASRRLSASRSDTTNASRGA